MKKLIVITLFLSRICLTYTQTDSLLLKNYEQKIIENSKLNNELEIEKKKFYDLSNAYKNDTLALQKLIKDLRKEVSSEKQEVLKLNKNKILGERDSLQKQVDSLIDEISIQVKTIAAKDSLIKEESVKAKTLADKAKNDGKAEILASIVNTYKNRPFDDLIKSSTKASVARDIQLLGNNTEVKTVLNDLLIYFNALELLSKKFDPVQIKTAQTQLGQINRPSKLLDALREDVMFYQDFYIELKETMNKIIFLDGYESADDDSEFQKSKLDKIIIILDYMYDYYDFAKYPYLSDILLEIIKRKQPNADANISDLLMKL